MENEWKICKENEDGKEWVEKRKKLGWTLSFLPHLQQYLPLHRQLPPLFPDTYLSLKVAEQRILDVVQGSLEGY